MQILKYSFNPGIGVEAFGTDIRASASGFLPVSRGRVNSGYPVSINITDCHVGGSSDTWVDFQPSTQYFAIFALTDPYAMSVEYSNDALVVATAGA